MEILMCILYIATISKFGHSSGVYCPVDWVFPIKEDGHPTFSCIFKRINQFTSYRYRKGSSRFYTPFFSPNPFRDSGVTIPHQSHVTWHIWRWAKANHMEPAMDDDMWWASKPRSYGVGCLGLDQYPNVFEFLTVFCDLNDNGSIRTLDWQFWTELYFSSSSKHLDEPWFLPHQWTNVVKTIINYPSNHYK